MSRYCCMCKAVEIPWDKSRRFHKFPKNNHVRETWLAAIGMESVAKTATLCSDHFSDSCYHPNDDYPTDMRILRTGAVPNQNLQEPESAQASSMRELRNIQGSQIEKCIEMNDEDLASFEQKKLDPDDSCKTNIDNLVQSSVNAVCSVVEIPASNELDAQMHLSHDMNQKSTAEESHQFSTHYTLGEDSNPSIDVLRRASIFKRKKLIHHPSIIAEDPQHSECTSQMEYESGNLSQAEDPKNSQKSESLHFSESDVALIAAIGKDSSDKPSSPYNSSESESSSMIGPNSYVTDVPKSEEVAANQHIHEDTTKVCKSTHLKRKIEMDEGELFPRKMRSGTDHNVEIMKSDKRIGLKRKIEMDKLEELPSKVRCMNGDEVIELSRDDFKSEEAFRRFLIMKLINDRKVKNLKQQNARKNQKISGFEELVKKLIAEKEFAAANFLKVLD